jgi:hypothetical protein
MQNVRYAAAIFDENGEDQGPVDLSSAQNDDQARDLAKQEGMKWLVENGCNRATVRISRDGYMLSVEVP